MNLEAPRHRGTEARRTAVAALIACALLASPVAAQDVGLTIGSTPPAAVVQSLDGQAADLTQLYVGKKPVLVEFWASWCENCAALLPRMEAAQHRYGQQVEFVVVGVGVNQTLSSMNRHIARHPMPFRFYFDNTGAAVRAFDAPATSYIVALDARGRVVYTGSGADQDIDAVARRAMGSR